MWKVSESGDDCVFADGGGSSITLREMERQM